MSDIDPEMLEEAINRAEELGAGYMSQYQSIIVAAARAHLATLPRYKEVEVEAWAAIYPSGEVLALHDKQESAAQRLPNGSAQRGFALVRLTGTAKVRA